MLHLHYTLLLLIQDGKRGNAIHHFHLHYTLLLLIQIFRIHYLFQNIHLHYTLLLLILIIISDVSLFFSNLHYTLLLLILSISFIFLLLSTTFTLHFATINTRSNYLENFFPYCIYITLCYY